MRFLFLALMLMAAAGLRSEVRLCGIQEDDLQLKPENNPYIITGDVLIKKRTLWTVNPGVVFKIANPASCTTHTGIGESEPNKKELIAIWVQGNFQCMGKADKRITFEPLHPGGDKIAWYGIVFDGANEEYTKLFYADISGAYYGVKVRNCSPVIRNCIIRKNQTGLYTCFQSKAKIFNNNILDNFSTGLLNESATPHVSSNLFMGNLTGIWSDQRSKVEIEYNDFWNNADGHFYNCPPRYGVIVKVNARKDSCDFNKNIFFDPVMAGSPAHADSIVHDVRTPTDTAKGDVANPKLSRVIVKSIPDSVRRADLLNAPHKPWQLSKYSRLIDAGSPNSDYRDADGSLNDIGVLGNSEFRFE
ncbi:MAG: right-handed parallel beta-helix repeat-containing protein [Fibrobacterota bacterium]